MKSTEKIFKQLKANPIAIEPLGLGNMPTLPETIVRNLENHNDFDTVRFTVNPLKAIITDAKVGDKYNYLQYRYEKEGKGQLTCIQLNKILSSNPDSTPTFVVLKDNEYQKSDEIRSHAVSVEEFKAANPNVKTEVVEILPSKIYFLPEIKGYYSFCRLLKEYYFEDEILSEIIEVKMPRKNNREAKEGRFYLYDRFRENEPVDYGFGYDNKVLIWENSSKTVEKQPEPKAVSNAIIPSKFEFPKFQVGDFVRLKELNKEGKILNIEWDSDAFFIELESVMMVCPRKIIITKERA